MCASRVDNKWLIGVRSVIRHYWTGDLAGALNLAQIGWPTTNILIRIVIRMFWWMGQKVFQTKVEFSYEKRLSGHLDGQVMVVMIMIGKNLSLRSDEGFTSDSNQRMSSSSIQL